MQYSYSNLTLFERCPRAGKYRYIDKLQGSSFEKNEAFIVGSAMHKGIETRSVDEAVKVLKSEAVIYDDHGVNEEIKIATILPRIFEVLDKFESTEHEKRLATKDFIGFVDLVADGDIYDFKYTSSGTKYLDGKQLNLYKNFMKDLAKRMFYVIIPKVKIRQRSAETLVQFRDRLRKTCKEVEIKKVEVEEDKSVVEGFWNTIKKIENEKKFEKRKNDLCDFCEYKSQCERKEVLKMEHKSAILPEAKRRTEEPTKQKIKLGIYGCPYCGKTTFANGADMPLFLNTDGNVKFIDAPVIPIKDERRQQEGSNIKPMYWGWVEFKKAVEALEAEPHKFKTVVVDLVESVYGLCRNFVCAEHGWKHESDDSFKAGDIIRKEFLDTMSRLTNLDMNVILISHEDATRDFTNRDGSTNTTFKPNIHEKVAKQLAGMVDITARIVVRDNAHILSFKHDETVFGGGRILLPKNEIPISLKNGYKDFEKLFTKED